MDDPLTERDIQAYADGTLPSARAARIARYLGARPDEAQRVAFYRHFNRRMQDAFGPVGAHRLHEPLHKRLPIASTLRNTFFAACFALAVTGWCVAAHVSADALDASAVMALVETSGPRSTNAPPLVSHDPHFVELTPIGLELVATKTRHAGWFARIDEFDYRNAEGETLILLSSSAPLAKDAPHWSARRAGDLRLLSWTSAGTRYVLAGHAGTRGLMRAADALTMTTQKAE